MNNEIKSQLRNWSREHLHEIWKHAKNNELHTLSNEEQQLAKIMLDHEDEFFDQFEFVDIYGDYEFDPETEVNPFLHIMIHSIVENQLNARNPIEVYQFYLNMKKRKLSHHDTIHLIGRILVPFIFYPLKQQEEFDEAQYKRVLKIYKNKKPEKIYSALDRDSDSILTI